MIQLEHIQIEEFRGIRDISIGLNSRSFAVHGPNGSGKSGVVDAIDFALTGNIQRLSGAGTGTVSLNRHAPHVHARETPESAAVTLKVKDPATGKSAVLKRSVGTPNSFTLTPDDPDVREALKQAEAHPELTLSRREIIQYIVSQPTTRATQIQALLKLDKLGAFRKNLNSANTKAAKSFRDAKTAVSTAENELSSHLGTSDLATTAVLEAVNNRRTILGASKVIELNDASDFLVDITASSGESTLNLASAITETNALLTKIHDLSTIDHKRQALSFAVAKAGDTAELLSAINRSKLLSSGLAEVVDNACPLCGHEWPDIDSLTDHVKHEIEHSKNASQLVASLAAPRTEYIKLVDELKNMIQKIVPIARVHGDRELPGLLTDWANTLTSHSGEFSSDEKTLLATELLDARQYDAPESTKNKLTALAGTLSKLPAQTETTDARTFLVIANERWTSVVQKRRTLYEAKTINELAKKAYDAYCFAMDESLEKLYRTVESDFSRYYRMINADDEGAFTARFTPSKGSLDFTVDFYGIDMFPPNAYHSEGHQDGMGVCLYLALMKQRLGAGFRLAVLDDVVMSVDTNHRRQFCELLKNEFPDVQFIITTHDQVWARQMESAGLITRKQQVRFFGWTVNDGPLDERKDIWERIDEDLKAEDVNGAAHKLRRHLEASTADIAEAIGGRVSYRGDGNYNLADFLSAVKSKHGDLLKLANNAATSWGNSDLVKQIKALRDERSAAINEHDKENWAINVLVHQNDWASMTPADFAPVLEASKNFLTLFRCSNENCSGWIHAVGHSPETLRCACNSYSLNLRKKSS